MQKFVLLAVFAVSLMASSQASALPVDKGSYLPSQVIEVQHRHGHGHARQHKRHYGHGHYRAGHRYAHPPRGWHRYGKRPGNWNTRGCVVVGPAWFCP